MKVVEPDVIGQILIECAEKYIIPRYKILKNDEIQTKTGPTDLVTQADLDVEAHLSRVLPDLYPDSVVLGEESVSNGEKSLDLLRDDTKMNWVVDPVDGTYNFVHGRDMFGIMLACVIEGQTQYGWIYDVPGDKLYMCEKGAGAYLSGVRLRVADETPMQDMKAHISYRFFPQELRDSVKGLGQYFSESHPLGCAAHEYTRIASGRSHAAVYSRLKAWDHLPGALMVQEAGGVVRKWDGSDFTPLDDYAGLLITNSVEAWHDIFNLINKEMDISHYL